MKIGICDDLEMDLVVTENFCRSYFAEHKIEAEIMSATGWEELAGKKTDLLILDIEMPKKSGIDIKKELEREARPLILFVTSYEEYMPEAFGKNVIGFMRKPLDKEHFAYYMDGAVRLLTAGKRITLEGREEVSTEEIRMLAADKRYTNVIFEDGRASRLQSKSLSAWERELEDAYFIRISPARLVNCKYIIDFVNDTITLTGGEKLKVSRRRKNECFARFMDYNQKFGMYL